MKQHRGIAFVLISLSAFAPLGWAQGHSHEDHRLTFSTDVALPNGVFLPAGTYVFKLPNRQHQLTQILSEDRSRVFATLQTNAVQRADAAGDKIVLKRGAADGVPVLRAWYCNGHRTGHEFAPLK